MTFNEAVEEMKVLAGGGVWALNYEVSSYYDGPRITGYIGNHKRGHADTSETYKGAIENVRKMLSPQIGDPAPPDNPVLDMNEYAKRVCGID